MRYNSDQRHGFWWAIGKTGLTASECDGFRGNDAHAREVSRRGIENVRKRARQRMQCTALIAQIERAVMVIGVGICDSRIGLPMLVRRDGHSFINIERVVVHERYDTPQLRDHEQAQKAGTEAAEGSAADDDRGGYFLCPSRDRRRARAGRLSLGVSRGTGSGRSWCRSRGCAGSPNS